MKQEGESFSESLKVVDVVEARSDFDIFEERHPENREDEHDQEEEEGDVDESRKCHDQREQQSPDSLCAFDQTKHSAYLCNSHLRKKCASHRQSFFQISSFVSSKCKPN